MDDWPRAKTALAVAALAVGFAAPVLLTGVAFAVDRSDGGGPDIDSYPVMQCPWINAERTNGGVFTGDQVCYVENAANLEGKASANY